MGATGTTVSDVQIEALGIRCPIGDCKVILGRPMLGSALVAGNIAELSNLLVIALESAALAATALVPCAYEVPKLQIGPTYQVKPSAGETWVVGNRLGFNQLSDLIQLGAGAGFSKIGYALEAKAANASECLIHFKGNTEAALLTST